MKKFLIILSITFLLVGCQNQSNIKGTKTQSKIQKNFYSTKNLSLEGNRQKGKLYKVIDVIDGDTIRIQGGQRVRYIGMNAPEKGEPYSSQATKLNQKLVLGKKVKLEFDVQKFDRYGRLLGYVWVGDILVNEKLVEEGLAVSETIPPNVKYQNRIYKAQKEAQKNCKGIWEDLCRKNQKRSCIRITKIQADAPFDDNHNKNEEFIELKNFCDYEISMKNWLLKDLSSSNRYIFKNFSLKPGSFVRIYSGCGKDTKDKLYWQCPEREYAIWNNNGDQAFLYDNQGNLIDTYKY